MHDNPNDLVLVGINNNLEAINGKLDTLNETLDRMADNQEKELHEIGEKGITAANLEIAYKLVDIAKDIGEIKEQEREEKEEGGSYGMRDYRGG